MAQKEPSTKTGRTIVYTHPTCGYCDLLKEDFAARGLEYDEVDVSVRPEAWSEVERLTGGEKITPVTVMADGEVQVGYKGIGCNYG